MLNIYMERKKEIIYKDKTLNDPQDLCTEADIPHKLPVFYSLGLRYCPHAYAGMDWIQKLLFTGNSNK